MRSTQISIRPCLLCCVTSTHVPLVIQLLGGSSLICLAPSQLKLPRLLLLSINSFCVINCKDTVLFFADTADEFVALPSHVPFFSAERN